MRGAASIGMQEERARPARGPLEGVPFIEKSCAFSFRSAAWTDPQGDKSGTWTAHILTGVALLLWGLHWTFATFCGWLMQTRQRPYRSRTAYSLPIVPSHWPIESVFKVLVPLAGILFNLIDANGWRSNVCPPGTAHAGHFNPDTAYSYANVWILVGFMLSGKSQGRGGRRT